MWEDLNFFSIRLPIAKVGQCWHVIGSPQTTTESLMRYGYNFFKRRTIYDFTSDLNINGQQVAQASGSSYQMLKV